MLTQATDLYNVQQFSYLRGEGFIVHFKIFMIYLLILVFAASLCET